MTTSRSEIPDDAVEAWGVEYRGVTAYESEAEARRQLNLAQMDVPAQLVKKVAGKWGDRQVIPEAAACDGGYTCSALVHVEGCFRPHVEREMLREAAK